MAKVDDATVRAVAGNAGFTVERANMKGCWRLIDQDGKRVRNPLTGSAAFTPSELVAFCRNLAAKLD